MRRTRVVPPPPPKPIPGVENIGRPTVRAVKSWVADPDTGVHFPVFTATEARLLIEMLDNQRAAGLLSDEDWEAFRSGKDKLLFMQFAAERAA